MIDLYTYINEGLLAGMEDTLDVGKSDVEKVLIEQWLVDNTEFVRMNFNRELKPLQINSKNELDIYSFNPLKLSFGNDNKMISLPTPDYIRFNKVTGMSIAFPDSSYAAKFDLNKLPHINYCESIYIHSHDTNPINFNLKDIKVDEFGVLMITINDIIVKNWPKSKIDITYLMVERINQYTEDIINSHHIDMNIKRLIGLKTDKLIIPDLWFTKNIDLVTFKKDITITSENQEYSKLLEIFNTKTFNKLYTYCVSGNSNDFYEITHKGDTFVIAGRKTKVLKNYW